MHRSCFWKPWFWCWVHHSSATRGRAGQFLAHRCSGAYVSAAWGKSQSKVGTDIDIIMTLCLLCSISSSDDLFIAHSFLLHAALTWLKDSSTCRMWSVRPLLRTRLAKPSTLMSLSRWPPKNNNNNVLVTDDNSLPFVCFNFSNSLTRITRQTFSFKLLEYFSLFCWSWRLSTLLEYWSRYFVNRILVIFSFMYWCCHHTGVGSWEGDSYPWDHVDDGSAAVDTLEHLVPQAAAISALLCHCHNAPCQGLSASASYLHNLLAGWLGLPSWNLMSCLIFLFLFFFLIFPGRKSVWG